MLTELMDTYTRIEAWATAAVLTNDFIREARLLIETVISPATAKYIGILADQFELEGVGELLQLAAEQVNSYEEMAAPALEDQIRSDAEKAAAAMEELDVEDRAAGALEAQIRSDGEKAAAALDERDVELANTIRQLPTEDEQERVQLAAKFDQERQELAGKLSTIEEKYFDGHPDLNADQRADAEATFKGVTRDALGSLEGRQQTERLQLDQMQEERRLGLTQAKAQVEQTRDERS